jgi:hypothetical protein
MLDSYIFVTPSVGACFYASGFISSELSQASSEYKQTHFDALCQNSLKLATCIPELRYRSISEIAKVLLNRSDDQKIVQAYCHSACR